MPYPSKAARNEQIFREILAGASDAAIAQAHGITLSRVDQILKREAQRQHPQLYLRVTVGRGHRARLLQALREAISQVSP